MHAPNHAQEMMCPNLFFDTKDQTMDPCYCDDGGLRLPLLLLLKNADYCSVLRPTVSPTANAQRPVQVEQSLHIRGPNTCVIW